MPTFFLLDSWLTLSWHSRVAQIEQIETTRDNSQSIVHVDLDAF
jgi:hypothetical protein